jgi:DHA2 family multidrug resistance protein
VTTVLARRAQVHQVMLANHTSLSIPAFRSSAMALGQQLSAAGAQQSQRTAYAMLYQNMKDQASTLSYIDTFWLLGIATTIMFVLSFFLKKNNPRGKAAPTLAH